MHIKSDEVLHYIPNSKHSFTITPEMGVIKHFPFVACKELIKKGAVEVKKSPKGAKASKAD